MKLHIDTLPINMLLLTKTHNTFILQEVNQLALKTFNLKKKNFLIPLYHHLALSTPSS
jgi:hypothetical protein